jgi:hypothetical protein
MPEECEARVKKSVHPSEVDASALSQERELLLEGLTERGGSRSKLHSDELKRKDGQNLWQDKAHLCELYHLGSE